MKTFSGLSIVAGHAALDLVNTVEYRMEIDPGDRLVSFAALVGWCVTADLISSAEAGLLLAQGALHPRRAGRTRARAIELREALHSVLVASIRKTTLPEQASGLIATWLRCSRSESELRYDHKISQFSWFTPIQGVEDILVRMAEPVDSLLTSLDSVAIRQCGGPRCDWLFLDLSHGQRRIWCQPNKCGNTVRVRRFRAH